MSQLAQKRVEQTQATEVKKNSSDPVISKKLSSVIFVIIAFVLLYLSLGSGNETMMWAGLGITIVSQIVMYLRF